MKTHSLLHRARYWSPLVSATCSVLTLLLTFGVLLLPQAVPFEPSLPPGPAVTADLPYAGATTINAVAAGVAATMSTVNGLTIRR